MIIVYLGRRGDADIPKTSLDNAERHPTGEEKTQFLRFVRQMLTWKPEERSSARELLHDPLCSKLSRTDIVVLQCDLEAWSVTYLY